MHGLGPAARLDRQCFRHAHAGELLLTETPVALTVREQFAEEACHACGSPLSGEANFPLVETHPYHEPNSNLTLTLTREGGRRATSDRLVMLQPS